MQIKSINTDMRIDFNTAVVHPLQSYEWGEFRDKTGIKVVRRGVYENGKIIDAFQMTIHNIPRIKRNIGYIPKSPIPSPEIIEEIVKIAQNEKCIFVQLEPFAQIENGKLQIDKLISASPNPLIQSTHPLFTKYNFVLDLTKSEDDLLKNMHQKTRYNIKVAYKHKVIVKEDNSNEAFEKYWQLTLQTTQRQKFYAHTKNYHKLQWDTFKHQLNQQKASLKRPANYNNLTSHLFTAVYEGKILTTMLFFVFKDTLYYPYGASSHEHRNVMHSTLTMWEAIKWGRENGLKKFDMWGALGKNPNIKDPWIGFHTFKERFGPKHIEYIGSFDLIIEPKLYRLYKIADKIRWIYLKLKNN